MANLRELHQELRRVQDRVFQHSLNKELEASYESHSKAWNKLYYARMHDRLPREIRDMINAEFWDEDYLKGFEGFEVAWKAKEEPTHYHRPGANRILRISHVVLPDYVGAEAAKENVQMWYENYGAMASSHCTWLVLSGNLGKHLTTAICKDTFGVGLDPATALRKMTIEVPDTSLVLGHEHSDFKDATSRQDALNLLLRIKKKRGFKLEIRIYHDCIRLNMWPEILGLLQPIVKVFEQEGAHVSVQSDYDPNRTDSMDEDPGVNTDMEHLIRTYDQATWEESMKPGLIDYFEGISDEYLRPYHRYYRSEEDNPGSDPDVAAWKRYTGPSGVRLKRAKAAAEKRERTAAKHEWLSAAEKKAEVQAMQELLPIELREMIYAQIWNAEYLNSTRQPRQQSGPLGHSDPRCHTHVVWPDFMGKETALELVQAWYEAASTLTPETFTISDTQESIKQATCEDRFQVGLDPAIILRTLTIDFDETTSRLASPYCKWLDADIRRNSFDLLHRLKKKAGFRLNFRICTPKFRLNCWPDFFDLLQPIVKTLENEGAIVDVQAIHCSRGPHPMPYVYVDLNSLVRGYDPATWKQSVIGYLDSAILAHPLSPCKDSADR
ncbi:hypothetical protein J4E85_008447 [Alternaria conjuncta]|uniref:uncharacterized protein n=1 Tax=Alternaria conjuncta TaxID=181017 RepID=UPI0022200D7D|nr:uncharacterized protein J4E85_008447 [Alternaria conjuncta]KAI4923409.1 hypothetical protein J4E85_008447 [Alternaria conjuncta]